MPFAYESGLVFLSLGVVLFGAFTALALTAGVVQMDGAEAKLRLATSGICFGLSAWAMQFIAFLALHLPVRLGYDPGLTALSAGAAILGSVCAFFLGWAGRQEKTLLTAGILMAAGLVCMHYFGLAAITGGLTPSFSWASYIVAFAISALTGLLAMWFTFRQRGVLITFGGAIMLGFVLAAFHYVGMALVEFVPGASIAGVAVPQFSEISLAWTAAVIVYIICSVCLAVYALIQFIGDSQ